MRRSSHQPPQRPPLSGRRRRLLWLTGALLCAALPATSEAETEVHKDPATSQVGKDQTRPPSSLPVSSWLWLRTPGLTASGGAGLHGMPTADAGAPWQLRTALTLFGFSQSDYLIAGDRNSLLSGTAQLDVTLGRYVEVWLTLGASSNKNERSDLYREDPQQILSLGNLGAGVKLHGLVGQRLDLALQPHLHLGSGGEGFGPDVSTLSPGVDFLVGLDVRRYRASVPLRLHLQVGYLQDRSATQQFEKDCQQGQSSVDECVHARIVSAAAYGLRQPRARLALGADVPIALGHYVALSPLFEYHVEINTGDGDSVVRDYLRTQVDSELIDRRVSQWLHFGLRLHTAIGVTADAGLFAGLAHPGYAYGPALPQVAGYGALTFSTDMLRFRGARSLPAPPPPVQASPPLPPPIVAPPVVIQKEAQNGRVRGVVRDARSGRPIPGAVVSFSGRQNNVLVTDARGAYESAAFPPGPLVVEVNRDEYDPVRSAAQVEAGRTLELDFSLGERAALPAVLRIDVTDDKGHPLPANVSLRRDGLRVDAPPDIGGGFLAQPAPGTWTVHADSEGFLVREQTVVLGRGAQQRIAISMRRRPQHSGVRLGAEGIALRSPLGFEPGTADLTPASMALLDEVGELLLQHPELRRVRIEGHTDNVGPNDINQQVSEDRAIAVRNYLMKLGVAPERLTAEGLGATQPLVPNLTPAGRAKNRRVVFKILER